MGMVVPLPDKTLALVWSTGVCPIPRIFGGWPMFWGVVVSQPQNERRALQHLRWQGFECYAPREKIVRVRRGRKINVVRYLFPRYLFVWIIDRWHDLSSTYGVSTVLMNGEVPSRLPASWVDSMKAKEHNGFIVLPKDRYRIGQRVQITGGLFQGQYGLYNGMTSRQREVVLLGALGKVELASGDLL